MKKFWILLFLVLPSLTWALEEGQPMPDFPVIALDEKKSQLYDHIQNNKLTYVEFWAMWCGTCKKSFPFLNELQNQYKDRGFAVIGMSLDEADEYQDKQTGKTIKDVMGVGKQIQEHLEEYPAEFDIFFGDATITASATQVESVPVAALLDSEGRVLAIHKGFNKKKAEKLQKEVKDYLDKISPEVAVAD